MIRFSSLLWLALVAVTGFTTFKVKYAVQDIEEELNKVRRQTIAEQQEIHVLRAEWTALTQPERLADLNRRFLSLAAVSPKQLQRKIEDIPLRLVPEPAEPVIAAAPAPAPLPVPAAAPAETPAVAGPATPVAPVPPGSGDVVVDMPAAVAVATPHPALPKIQLIATAEAAPIVAQATGKVAPVKPDSRPQSSKGKPAVQPRSLDRLIDAIAEGR
jgi:hypothetical protein